MKLSTFIRSIELDERKRIVITVQDAFQNYLKKEKVRNYIYETVSERLAPDFIRMDIQNGQCFIIVKPGTEEKNRLKVKQELSKAFRFLLRFMLK